MDAKTEIRRALEDEIREAFRGVTLGGGMSLRQAQYVDRVRDASWNADSASRARGEITGDWSQIPRDELNGDCVAHLDAEGFRYYIPALMLSVLDHYDCSSMRVIGTISSLYPKKDNSWEYHMHRYSLLTAAQKLAIARFLVALPATVELAWNDQRTVPRALHNYWRQFLPTSSKDLNGGEGGIVPLVDSRRVLLVAVGMSLVFNTAFRFDKIPAVHAASEEAQISAD